VTGVLGSLGDLVEDVVVWLAEPLAIGTDAAGSIIRTRGGSAANVASAAAGIARVGVRYLGCVGSDPTGDGLVAGLEVAGVDVRVQRRGRTGTILVLVEPGGERSMVPDRGSALLLEAVADEWLDGLSVLHVPAYGFCGEPLATSVLDALRRAKDRGIATSVDASSVGTLRGFGRDRIRTLLADLSPDHLLANAEEAAFLGVEEPGYLPYTTVVVKHGAQPTVAWTGGQRVEVPVQPVSEVRDTTGAGDAFAAGYLTAVIEGAAVGSACDAGNRVAATALGRAGAL
jgi:sugar/nucleoside kinase (ribokinase family)